MLTADHGCDLTSPRTDHTREHAPLLARFDGHGSRRHDGPLADVGASVLDWLAGARADELPGESFIGAGAVRASLMPELPEVETIRRQLAPHLEGRHDRRAWRSSIPAGPGPSRPGRWPRRLRGRPVAARAAGTASTWCGSCSGELYLLMHLRMTGALLFDPGVEPAHTGCASSSTAATGWSTSIRGASAPATWSRARRRATPT